MSSEGLQSIETEEGSVKKSDLQLHLIAIHAFFNLTLYIQMSTLTQINAIRPGLEFPNHDVFKPTLCINMLINISRDKCFG